MNTADTNLILDILSLAFIFLGAIFVLSAAVGLVRFKDSLSRVHAITKPQTLGLVLTVIGALLRLLSVPEVHRSDMGVLVLLVFFTLITSPITGQRVGRLVRREALYGQPETMARNEAPAERAIRRT
ncbi:cation:proton antiporter [Corynebacterium sp. sy017]|uniref:monovalent cation/H(+) antiporter subunit G n=1 Tax=unclassified Corynebacterium TaxID=2624378 RepID=UPI001184BF37|nr:MULTISPECIES: monovalent cation/H(+) antiporter subunit G [unclassified Corynebacterium]MBP3088453.1 cation:proton antiporter [Corynebacterium sp. sy017]QDZ41888.1 cation:proton antiporter [Corynebacterium sp. sy039]TSD91762.1 cation:proton antiporter [Corynebacterium sp. SY003]